MTRVLIGVIFCLVLAATCGAQEPGEFSDVFVFGDSLSDQGNLSAATLGLLPGFPYFNGRFSDGPVWVENLAADLGVTLTANGSNFTTLTGNNYAIASARVERSQNFFLFTIPSVRLQISSYLDDAALPLSPETLYVVGGGANDIRDALDPTFGLGGVTPMNHVAFIAAELAAGVQDLVDAGAKYVLVPNAPDIGVTPESLIVNNNAAMATTLSIHFCQQLTMQLDAIRASENVCIVEVDFLGLTQDIYDDAVNNGGAVYGITNGTTPIFAGFAGSTGADPATSLFADDLHPSAVVHQIAADFGLASLADPKLPGTGEDFSFDLRVDGFRPPASCAAYAGVGQSLELTLASPAGSQVGAIATLVGQAFVMGMPPQSPLSFPELHINQFGAVSLGVYGVFSSGTVLNVPVLPGLQGTELHLQGIISSSTANNGFFLASDARHLVLE